MRLKSGQRSEPEWRLRVPSARQPDPEMAGWLYDSGSLTRRLRRAGAFRVNVLKQTLERPLFCERRALGLPDRALALVRQVHLCCDGEIKVYARSVVPLSASGRVARLGGRPLGELLFRDRSMRRGAMEIAPVEMGDLFHRWGVPEGITSPVWGRRSVFRLRGRPLLVNEVFLPPLPKAVGFRVKHKV